MATSAPPRFYFSLRSPYSWLAWNDLRRHHPEVLTVVELRPFWEPDKLHNDLLEAAGGEFPYTPMSRAKHFYILQDVRRLAAERGLSVQWPIDHEPRWEVPHLAYFLAEREGAGAAYIDRVTRARWQEGRNICDPATIADVAAELGLPPDRLAGAADDADLRGVATEALLRIDRDGVFGVPFFVYRRTKFWGVDRLPAFILTLREHGTIHDDYAQPGVPHSPLAMTSADLDHAGGCG